MARINVTDPEGRLVGWYDNERAKYYAEGLGWNGSNEFSLATGSQWAHEGLVQTAQGRWVLRVWSGDVETRHYISGADARLWLIRNEYNDDSIADILGETPPPEIRLGRPAIGDTVKVKLPVDVRTAVDAAAETAGLTRAAWIRAAIDAHLQHAAPERTSS